MMMALSAAVKPSLDSILPALSRPVLTLWCALAITLLANTVFWQTLYQILSPVGFAQLPFVLSAVVLVFAIVHAICHVLAIGQLQKIWLMVVFLCSAAASYYQWNYHILYDKTMMLNIIATDYTEAHDFLNIKIFLWLGVMGVLPAVMIFFWPIKKTSIKSHLWHYVLGYLISIGLIVMVALFFYKEYASLLRTHRELKHLIIPSSFMNSLYGLASDKIKVAEEPLRQTGLDAHLGPLWAGQKPVVLVLVVGETARRANFSLAGYGKNTNPALAKEDIVFFDQTTSCGTATAVSLPCMFARETRSNFDLSLATHRENLLDVVKRAGLNAHWMDNNTGCKGICQRISFEETPMGSQNEFCREGECFDMFMLQNLTDRFEAKTRGNVIVIHQKGSHGPNYYKRSPEGFKPFLPECESNELQRCTSEEITNAYDNTIFYTDYFLGQLINQLKSYSQYATAMLYVSDHGESLGENGFYLHGIPYALAPKEQKEVPMVLWASDDFKAQMNLNWGCLKNKAHQPLSHDYYFSSVLSLLNIQTTAQDPALDFISDCQEPAHL